jgi:hypothetical protein
MFPRPKLFEGFNLHSDRGDLCEQTIEAGITDVRRLPHECSKAGPMKLRLIEALARPSAASEQVARCSRTASKNPRERFDFVRSKMVNV